MTSPDVQENGRQLAPSRGGVSEKFSLWFFLAFIFLIPVSNFWSVRVLVLTLTTAFIFRTNVSWTDFFYRAWDSLLYVAVLVLGILYSDDVFAGLRVLETNFSFLAIPLIVFQFRKIDDGLLKKIFYAFGLGLITSCIISVSSAFISFVQGGELSEFFYYNLTDTIKLHPTYLAYYLIFAITLCFYWISYQTEVTRIAGLLVALVLFYLVLLLTGGQTAFVSLLFAFSFFVLKFLVDARTRPKAILFLLIVVMMVGMFSINSSRYQRELNLNDSWERFDLWESAMKATTNLVTGVGTGDDKVVLNQYYQTHNMGNFAIASYNSHNQFIQIILTNGILGLASILILIGRPIYLAAKNRHVLGILVFFPFLIYGTTEVFLGRYQGVSFFALLQTIFIGYYSTLGSPHASKD